MKNSTALWLLAIVLALAAGQAAGQSVWTKDARNPVLSGPAGYVWNHHVFMPCVLYNTDSSRYEMWFGASFGSPWRPYQIGFASSKDGINWSMYPTPVLSPTPGAWDAYTVEQPAVLRENGQYKMWYSSALNVAPAYPGYIGYATSPDGINWTKYSGNPVMAPVKSAWEGAGGAYTCSVLAGTGEYHMWYAGFDSISASSCFGHAVSSDGITWQRDTLHNPVLRNGGPGHWDYPYVEVPQVVRIGGTYYIWYLGTSSDGSSRRVGLATSTDAGITWTKFSGNPVLSPTAGRWDGSLVEPGTVLLRGDTLHMWYSGVLEPAGSNLWRIGHATSPMPRVRHRVPQDYATIQAGIDAASVGDTVLVAEGRYKENIALTKKITVGSLYIADGDTAHISQTIIDGSQYRTLDSAAVVTVDGQTDTTTVLAGFTITGGKGNARVITYPGVDSAAYRGGFGIDIAGGGARIHHNKVQANNYINTSEYFGGGAITIFDPNDKHGVTYVIVEDNAITDNTLFGDDVNGAGVAVGHSARIRGNVIARNSAAGVSLGIGGGLQMWNGDLIIENNMISDNVASHQGGGLYICSVPDLSLYPSVVLTNNIIARNSANSAAGGLYAIASGLVVTSVNNTFAANSTTGPGAGISVQDTAVVYSMNTIFWDLGSTEIDTSGGGSFVAYYCDIKGGYTGTGNISFDPAFVPGDPLFNLQLSSRCIGRAMDKMQFGGVWCYAPQADYDGDPRPMPNGPPRCDIGAQEELITGVKDRDAILPNSFALEQNYPNPFNPTTAVSYQLPAVSDVRLVVYDILGRKAAVLVNEKKAPGRYEVRFDATGLASGVYLYRLTAGNFVQTRKMVVVK